MRGLKSPQHAASLGYFHAHFGYFHQPSLLQSQHTTEMLEPYESLTADCNQPLLPTKMLARLTKKKPRSLNWKSAKSRNHYRAFEAFVNRLNQSQRSITIQLVLPQIRGHYCSYMYSTRVDLEFSDLHSDESQSLAPRTSQPSLHGPTDRPQGLSIQ